MNRNKKPSNKENTFSCVLIIVQRDATQISLFIILQVHSTCFGCRPHPSSGVHKTVTTASRTVQLTPSDVAKLGHVGGRQWTCRKINRHTKQFIYYSASSLNMLRVSTTPFIRSKQNCNYSLRYCVATSFQHGQATLATLEGGSCTKNMTSNGGYSYSFVCAWWLVWLTPETCRMNLQNNK